jgi:hypothetical protein
MNKQPELPLERSWSIGSFHSFKKNQWSPKELGDFDTVQKFWFHVNNRIVYSKVNFLEYWFFEKGLLPDWETIKKVKNTKELTEITLKNVNDEIILDSLMILVGETIPQSEYVFGVRVKSIRRGKEVRFWISGYKNVHIISNFLKKEFGKWKEVEFSRTDF